MSYKSALAKSDVSKIACKTSVSLAALLIASDAAFAQSSTESFLRDEIIVTAQKREQNLQDVPIAITVFSGDELDVRGIVDIQSLSQRTPGFTAGAKDASASQFSIRGIGSVDDGAAADNSVIVYIDDVPIGRASGQDLDLFDLERVEVLRGPQGTLFGRNAVGGAVSLVTKKPTEELEIKAETRIGNFNRQDFRGLISGPIADNVFGKISFSSRNRDGILDSTIDEVPGIEAFFTDVSSAFLEDIDALDIDTTTLRGGLRLVSNDNLEVNLSASYSTLDQSGPQRVFIGEGQEFGVRGDALLPGRRDDFHQEFFENPGFAKIDSWNGAVRADYTLDNDVTLTSITSIRKIDAAINDQISSEIQSRALLSLPSTQVDSALIAPTSNDHTEDVETFTQELRLTSGGDKKLDWVVGAFYLNEDVRRNETVNLGVLARDDATGDVNVVISPAESGDDQDVTVNSYAVFGQASYEIMDGVEITAGLRYTSDEKDITRLGTADGVVVAAPFFVENSATFDEFTPKLSLSYEPHEDLLLYASYSRGFKSGGFQGRGTSAASVREPFDPEIADSYEAGLKATLLDGRLQINPTVFHTDFRDLQTVELLRPAGSPPNTTASLVTQNAANAEINGVEVEYIFNPITGLELAGSLAYLDAEFVEFFAPQGFETEDGGPLLDRSGNRLLQTPEWAITQIASYEWDVPALNGALRAQGEYIYQDEVFGDVQNDPDVARPAYDLVNLSLTYIRDGDHRSELSLWMDNAFNEDYLVNSFSQDGGGRALPGAPRTYGATLRWAY